MQNLYEILEVSEKASQEVIEKAYKVLVKKYHPDLQDTPEKKMYAEEMIKKVNEAYEILSDNTKKEEYDAKLKEEEQKKIRENYNQNNNSNYQNTNNYQPNNQYTNSQYNDTQGKTPNNNYQDEGMNNNFNNGNNTYTYNLPDNYYSLSPKQQRRVRRRLEREAKEDYIRRYEKYYRSLGYKVRHRWTLKDFETLALFIILISGIFGILWIIPPTRSWMIELYNSNIIIKVIVNVIRGFFSGIAEFFKNITKIGM